MKAIIVAMDLLGQIGDADTNRMLWEPRDLPADMARFKALTTGNVVVMGRKTWESMDSKPLSGRTNLIITPQHTTIPLYNGKGFYFLSNLEQVIDNQWWRKDVNDNIFFIGGASIYREALDKDLVDTMFITQVIHKFEVANPVKFPMELKEIYEGEKWNLVAATPLWDNKYNTIFYHFVKNKTLQQ